MERHITPESRLQVMEEATELALVDNAEKATKLEQLDQKFQSPESEVLNNQAELAIFGDGGENGKTDYEVKSLNDSGEVVVEYKFKDTEPLKGLVDVRANPRYGKSSERDKAADKYIREYKRLIKKESLQPAQAKLLMDMKMDDAVSASEQVDARVRSGEKRSDASKAVKARYEKKFASQLDLVRNEGIMTTTEYEEARNKSSQQSVNEVLSPAESSRETEVQETVNTLDSPPNLSTRKVEQRQIDAANYALVKAAAEGDEELFAKAEGYLRNEVTANEMITGVKGLDAFEKVVAQKRNELAANKLAAEAETQNPNEAQSQDNNDQTPVFAAPNAADIKVRKYEDDNGKPVAGLKELFTIMDKRVADGDSHDWDELTATIKELSANTGSIRGVDSENLVELIKHKIRENKKKLDENSRISSGSQVDTSLPEIVEQTPVVVPPIPPAPNTNARSNRNEKSSWKKKLAAAGLGALAATGFMVAANYVDDNYVDEDKTVDESPSEESSKADDIRNSGALNGGNEAGADSTSEAAEQLEAIEKAVAERTGEISDAEGSTPWSRAESMYGGNNATPRIISAVEALQTEGVDAQIHGDPNAKFWVSIDGNSNTDYVWNRLAQEMGQQDVAGYLSSLDQNS